MDYNDFDLHLSGEAPNLYRAAAVIDGSVAAEQVFELRTGELKVLEGMRRMEESAIKPSNKETFHEDFGMELYNKVFTAELGDCFNTALEDAQENGRGLRICLRFAEDAQDIAAMPWEFLNDGDGFLVVRRETLISRLPPGIKKTRSSPLTSILRMLVIVSSPNDPEVAPLNTEFEQEVILEAVDKLYRDHRMDVDFTEDASFETIQSYLTETDYHIVHFTGHGAYKNGKGYLLLEKEDGGARAVDSGTIVEILSGQGVRLVVLSACQSGKKSSKEAYADIASNLAKAKIPAVLAMQYPILDKSATKLASVFYQALTSGKPVDLALTEARTGMKNAEKSNGIDFATPILYLQDPECVALGEIVPDAPELFNKPLMLGDVQMMKKGFIGRRKELRSLQKDFKSDVKRAAIIYGFGGIGKTVLATRLALKMNRHFEGVFGMRCNTATRPEDILNELNAFLNLAGISQLNEILYQPLPLKVKTAALVNILNQRRYLIILDNFEDCLDETRSKIANPELGEFIRHLLNNTITNTKIIITTRYNFDPLEGRLTASIAHISVPELRFPETVWLMNNYGVLADLDMEKKHRIYGRIGGHPWTIGQFVKHAEAGTVDGVLLELEPLKQEVIQFTLLDRSYPKLDQKARALLLRASVYQEAVPVEALSWMMGDEKEPSPAIGDALSRIMDGGLIAREEEREETRYAMHTLVREFAEGEMKKEDVDRKQLLVRAAQYYENQAKTTKNLWDLLRAREYYYHAEEWETAHEIAEVTHEYLVRWGYIELAINLLSESIATTSGMRRTSSMFGLGMIWHRLGDLKTALNIYNKVKEEFEELEDGSGIASILHQLGMIHQDQGNYEEAEHHYQQSIEIKEELGDKSDIASTLHQLGTIHQAQGNYEGAGRLYQQSLKINEELEDGSGIASILHQLGMIHQDQGNYEEAEHHYQQSIEIKEELGDKSGIAITLHNLAAMHEKKDGDFPAALEKYLKALLIFRELHSPDAAIAENDIARLNETMGEEAFSEAMEDIRRKYGA